MSVFGGDSWGRDAQQRKRRVDELMRPASGSSSRSAPDSFKRLPNGKLACLVCPHRPVLDSFLMLSMHNKGAQHMAAESRLREKEFSRQHEINKRLALSSDTTLSTSNPHNDVMPSVMKEKPLIEQTRRAILETQSIRLNNFGANKMPCDQKKVINDSSSDAHVSPAVSVKSIECNRSKGEAVVGNQSKCNIVSEWQADFQKRQEQELRFTASGWKRDCHGKWYRDENILFDLFEHGHARGLTHCWILAILLSMALYKLHGKGREELDRPDDRVLNASFDVVRGTSLTLDSDGCRLDKNERPLLPAKDPLRILPQKNWIRSKDVGTLRMVGGPEYNGKYLHSLLGNQQHILGT